MAINEARSIGNALLGFPFKVEFNGYPAFLVHKCKIPGVEVEVTELVGGGQTLAVKQAGGEKVTDMSLTVIVPYAGEERLYWQKWREAVRTRDTRRYYRDGTIILLGPNDEPSIIWDVLDAWPSKIETEDFDAEDKKKLTKINVTLQCYDCVPRLR